MDAGENDVRVMLRAAVSSDCEQVYAWRNHESTRKYFFNPEPVLWEEHLEWFQKVLSDDSVHLLIGECDGEPVGVLRYDVRGQSAEVSVYVVPGKTGLGLGFGLLDVGKGWVRENLSGVHVLKARIHCDNKVSLGVFEKAGFRCNVCELSCDLY